MNPHNKKGRKIQFTAAEWTALTNNVHLDTLMNWTEDALKCTTTIISPQFFHPSFTERQKDIIVSLIWTCYAPVEHIERVGKDGICIHTKELLNLQKHDI